MDSRICHSVTRHRHINHPVIDLVFLSQLIGQTGFLEQVITAWNTVKTDFSVAPADRLIGFSACFPRQGKDSSRKCLGISGCIEALFSEFNGSHRFRHIRYFQNISFHHRIFCLVNF